MALAFLVACCGVSCRQGLCCSRGPGAGQFSWVPRSVVVVAIIFIRVLLHVHVVIVLQCLVFGATLSECFSVFSSPPLPFVFITLLLLLLLVITVIIISTELLALCDRCLGWGWVWLAGLVAGCG